MFSTAVFLEIMVLILRFVNTLDMPEQSMPYHDGPYDMGHIWRVPNAYVANFWTVPDAWIH